MMLHHSGAPIRLWSWAAAHAAFVWNRSHISASTGVTPYESLRGKKPSLKHLGGTWGCDAYCHVPKEQRAALEAKAEPCIYLGHDEVQNAAHVLLLSSKKVICSRDVKYRSGSFTFMKAFGNGHGDASVPDSLTSHDDGEALQDADRVPAQGGQGSSVPSKPKEDSAAEVEEWVVDSILAERKRRGRTEYKVHWSGFGSDEDSWEPASQLQDLEALDVWQSQRGPPPPARRSVRHGGHASDDAERAQRYEEADSDPEEPQVHMALCALRNLQLPDEQPDRACLMSAVAAGIAALEQQTPQTYREAMASPDAAKWKAALDKEMRSCVEQEVWALVRRDSLPRGTNVLPCKEVFKLKVDEHGEVVEHKARVTPKGFRQKRGVDFFETYARTGLYKTLRVALSLAAKWDHELAQFDVPTAFLNTLVDEDIYMELPEGYDVEIANR